MASAAGSAGAAPLPPPSTHGLEACLPLLVPWLPAEDFSAAALACPPVQVQSAPAASRRSALVDSALLVGPSPRKRATWWLNMCAGALSCHEDRLAAAKGCVEGYFAAREAGDVSAAFRRHVCSPGAESAAGGEASPKGRTSKFPPLYSSRLSHSPELEGHIYRDVRRTMPQADLFAIAAAFREDGSGAAEDGADSSEEGLAAPYQEGRLTGVEGLYLTLYAFARHVAEASVQYCQGMNFIAAALLAAAAGYPTPDTVLSTGQGHTPARVWCSAAHVNTAVQLLAHLAANLGFAQVWSGHMSRVLELGQVFALALQARAPEAHAWLFDPDATAMRPEVLAAGTLIPCLASSLPLPSLLRTLDAVFLLGWRGLLSAGILSVSSTCPWEPSRPAPGASSEGEEGGGDSPTGWEAGMIVSTWMRRWRAVVGYPTLAAAQELSGEEDLVAFAPLFDAQGFAATLRDQLVSQADLQGWEEECALLALQTHLVLQQVPQGEALEPVGPPGVSDDSPSGGSGPATPARRASVLFQVPRLSRAPGELPDTVLQAAGQGRDQPAQVDTPVSAATPTSGGVTPRRMSRPASSWSLLDTPLGVDTSAVLLPATNLAQSIGGYLWDVPYVGDSLAVVGSTLTAAASAAQGWVPGWGSQLWAAETPPQPRQPQEQAHPAGFSALVPGGGPSVITAPLPRQVVMDAEFAASMHPLVPPFPPLQVGAGMAPLHAVAQWGHGVLRTTSGTPGGWCVAAPGQSAPVSAASLEQPCLSQEQLESVAQWLAAQVQEGMDDAHAIMTKLESLKHELQLARRREEVALADRSTADAAAAAAVVKRDSLVRELQARTMQGSEGGAVDVAAGKRAVANMSAAVAGAAAAAKVATAAATKARRHHEHVRLHLEELLVARGTLEEQLQQVLGAQEQARRQHLLRVWRGDA